MSRSQDWAWTEVVWPRPFDPDRAFEVVDRLAADRTLGPLVFEARARHGQVRHLLGCESEHESNLRNTIRTLVPLARVHRLEQHRHSVQQARRVGVSHNRLALSVDRTTSISRAVLAALSMSKATGEEVVLQVLVGSRVAPHFVANTAPDPRAGWVDSILGNVRPASAEVRSSMRTKGNSHGFNMAIRVGATAGTPGRARALISGVINALRVAEAAGVRLHHDADDPAAIDTVRRPWRWPLQISAREAVGLLGWPVGDGDLPGVPGEHPKLLPPPHGYNAHDRVFASSSSPGKPVQLGITARDSLQHTVLMGPTGSGKSNAMLNLIMADIEAGRSVLVIDPKTDLTNDVLARIPEHRRRDVVVIDPMDASPVGLNPLNGSRKNPELVADSILAVFKDLFADSWGPRTQDVLSSALITLAHHDGATLTMLPALLTNTRFRRRLTKDLKDQLGLLPFWEAYEAMSVEQRAQVIAPVMNKVRQFLLRPALRGVLGQADPLFNMNDLFTKRRIVLISLNKGLIGAESARLLGSLVVSQLWPLTLARAGVSPEKRHIVSIYIDEVQDYLSLPTDLADALSQARGLGVGFTLAHQYRAQLPTSLRAGVDANARNKIIFGLNATDAAEMAKQAVDLDTQDFMLLPRFGVYAHLMRDGHSTGWISGQTNPASAPTSDVVDLRATSSATYGRDAHEVEQDVLNTIGIGETPAATAPEEPIGRRPSRRTKP